MSQTDQLGLYSLSLCYFLKRHSVSSKDKIAIIDGMSGVTITYGELYKSVSGIAGWLSENGIRHGDRVACLALNGKSFMEFILALNWIGAVAVPLNIRLNPKELSYIIEDSGAKAMFSCGFMVENAELALADIDGVELRIIDAESREGWISYSDLIDGESRILEVDENISGETLCTLIYTSGTTGKPKGGMIPQRVWTGYAINMTACFQMGADDVYLAFLPYFHIAGFGTAFAQLVLGGTVVTSPLPDPAVMYDLIEKHRVTFVFLVPPISAALANHEAGKKCDISSLKAFIAGAGAETVELVDKVEKDLGAKYYGIYGQTEAGGKVTWADGDMIRKDPTTYGHIMPFFDYRIMDIQDREVEPGEIGELCLRGQMVMQGYWNLPEVTANTIKNGWHHTGDLFKLMDTGQVKMVDRSKYLIKTGGENVYPQEVEQILWTHNSIADATVIGVVDKEWGESVKAFVILEEGASLSRQDIAQWVEQSIASYKKPRFIEFVDTIPRNVSGKVLKNELALHKTTDDQKV